MAESIKEEIVRSQGFKWTGQTEPQIRVREAASCASFLTCSRLQGQSYILTLQSGHEKGIHSSLVSRLIFVLIEGNKFILPDFINYGPIAFCS